MALFNYTAKEITLKIVYYGPGFSGKTTNLQNLHSILPNNSRGKLISLTTEADRTLFFDFLPIDVGKIKEFNIRFQLYTVPGQVRYNATRRLVLKGADAIVFVADSQQEMKDQNIESYDNMKENLTVNNIDPDDTPIIFQYNKRDVKNIMSIGDLNNILNKENAPFFEAVAVEGRGVKETFKEITDNLIKHIAKKHKVDIEAPIEILSSGYKPPAKEALDSRPHAAQKPAPELAVPKPPPSRPGAVPTAHPQAVRPAVVERAGVQQPPVNLDVSELVSAIGELGEVIREISNSLKEMQKKHTKISNELYEIRQIFSGAKKDKGFKKFFR